MFESLILCYANLFNKFLEEGKDEWIIVKGTVPVKILNELYNKFINQKVEPITPLEHLTIEQKTKYWNISKKYYSDTEQRIRAAKAAYTLSLITSNE